MTVEPDQKLPNGNEIKTLKHSCFTIINQNDLCITNQFSMISL